MIGIARNIAEHFVAQTLIYISRNILSVVLYGIIGTGLAFMAAAMPGPVSQVWFEK